VKEEPASLSLSWRILLETVKRGKRARKMCGLQQRGYSIRRTNCNHSTIQRRWS